MRLLLKVLLALVVLVGHTDAMPALSGAAVTTVSSREQQVGGDTYVTAYLNVSYRDARGELHTERSETAKFGDGRIGNARGVLVHVMSPNAPGGCAPPLIRHASRYHNSTALPTEPWIALVPRGHCTFDMKVHTAAHAGASAVIVYDDKEGDALDMMDISPEHNITAVLTYHWKGVTLAQMADGPARIVVEITVANRCTRSLNSINRTSVLFVSVSFIVLMIISLAWLVFYYVQRFRYIHAKDRLSRRLCNAAKRALSKIPTRRLKMDDPELIGEGDCCAICIERYRVGDVVRALPCSNRHEFHKSCIDPWLLDHRTCPMCKVDILKHYGFVFTGSQESILHLDIEEVAAFGINVESPHHQAHLHNHHHHHHHHDAPQSPIVITHHHMPQPPSPQTDDEVPPRVAMLQATQDCSHTCTAEVIHERSDSRASPRPESYSRRHRRDKAQPAQDKAQNKDNTQDREDTAAAAAGDAEEAKQAERPASPGAVSTTSVASDASCCSGDSRDSGDSASSVTDSILPSARRGQRPAQIMGCGTSCAFVDRSADQAQS